MKRLEALRTLLDCYLHEDWVDDYPDLWHAVDDFIDGEPDWAPRFNVDVQQLLGECQTEQEIERRLDQLGMVYNPLGDGWDSYRAWLLAVAAHVEDALHKSPAA
jgi:hypothetical protein